MLFSREEVNSIAGQIGEILGFRDLLNTSQNEAIIKINEVLKEIGGAICKYDDLEEKRPDKKVYGYIIKKNKKNFEIYINNRYPEFWLFTIAHEIGHLFLHMGYLINNKLWKEMVCGEPLYKGETLVRFEMEADEFASALLMPEDVFKKVAKEFKNDISKISNYFHVSEDLVRLRGWYFEVF